MDYTYFKGGSKLYGNVELHINPQQSGLPTPDYFLIDGDNSFDSLHIEGDGKVKFDDNSTQTILDEYGLTLTGLTEGGLQLTGTDWSISMASGIAGATNCTITNSTAVGGAFFKSLISDGNVDGGGNTGWVFEEEPTPSNKSVFLRFNDINIAKGTRLLPESILLTLNLSSIITELTNNTIKVYINEIDNVISSPTTIEEFNALVLSEPILYQTNLQSKNITSLNIDITELIKKVINLETWSPGNSIMLVLKNDDPLFLKFFDFSENADKVAMISKTDVTTTSNIETGIILY